MHDLRQPRRPSYSIFDNVAHPSYLARLYYNSANQINQTLEIYLLETAEAAQQLRSNDLRDQRAVWRLTSIILDAVVKRRWT